MAEDAQGKVYVTNLCPHGVNRRYVCQTCLGIEMAVRRTKEKIRDNNEKVRAASGCPLCLKTDCRDNDHLFAPPHGDAAYAPRDKAFDYKPVHHMELDPKGIDAKAPGAKLDAGKSPVRRGLLEYFPRACLEVAGLSADGAKKYSWGGWASVEGGVDRYGDAEVRHICKAAIEGPVDPDFKRLHATHEAWNALARLELILRQNTVQV